MCVCVTVCVKKSALVAVQLGSSPARALPLTFRGLPAVVMETPSLLLLLPPPRPTPRGRKDIYIYIYSLLGEREGEIESWREGERESERKSDG